MLKNIVSDIKIRDDEDPHKLSFRSLSLAYIIVLISIILILLLSWVEWLYKGSLLKTTWVVVFSDDCVWAKYFVERTKYNGFKGTA